MENKIISTKSVHCLVLPFPAHGHTNPMLEFSKRLQQREGVKVTLVTTISNYNNIPKLPPNSITVETISDGFDKGGVAEAKDFIIYLNKFWQVGPQSLAHLINNLNARNDHVDCLIYDSFMPWCLDVAKKFGIVGASFLTQNLAMNSIYYHVHLGKLKPPFAEQEISLPALPQLQHRDMPCFYFTYEEDPTFLDLVVAQFSNIHKADWILCNSFFELEKEVSKNLAKKGLAYWLESNDAFFNRNVVNVLEISCQYWNGAFLEWLQGASVLCRGKSRNPHILVAVWTMKTWSNFRTIGPCLPNTFLDKQIKDDEDYGVAQLKSDECLDWLNNKPKRSVVYVSFGSMARVKEEQIKEVAYCLKDCGSYFLWILEVLAHEAIGCFVTHCGWNSTLEALSIGVPIVAMPLDSDQGIDAKFVADVWKVGIRTLFDEKQIKGKEIMNNVMQWKTLAARAVGKDGSSHKNMIEFVSSLFQVPTTN
ncbi:UDP-glucosyltransferase family protein [Medicago truncatula]|uniref:UDP-glucosyltransferase family protein n=1 Tax=Medicago truncatula TaxID=3880 RepID=G7KSI2_MEDTR|nr:UDP-glucosyltransferase family protein [Medicago truncatula]